MCVNTVGASTPRAPRFTASSYAARASLTRTPTARAASPCFSKNRIIARPSCPGCGVSPRLPPLSTPYGAVNTNVRSFDFIAYDAYVPFPVLASLLHRSPMPKPTPNLAAAFVASPHQNSMWSNFSHSNASLSGFDRTKFAHPTNFRLLGTVAIVDALSYRRRRRLARAIRSRRAMGRDAFRLVRARFRASRRARASSRVVLCGDVAPRARGSGTAAAALRDAVTRARDAMPVVADGDLPEDTLEALAEFEAATEAIERALAPFLDADRKTLTKELRPLERAEVHCEAARAIVGLFGMYLKTLGVDPEKHATAKEMKRVEAYGKKIEETRARLGDGARGASAGGRKASVDVETAAKAIKDGVGSPGDLLKASLAAAGGGKADDAEDGKEDGAIVKSAPRRRQTKGRVQRKRRRSRFERSDCNTSCLKFVLFVHLHTHDSFHGRRMRPLVRRSRDCRPRRAKKCAAAVRSKTILYGLATF